MTTISRRNALIAGAGLATFAATPLRAQQVKLKWAHVYEIGEPYHTEAVWAAARSPNAPTASSRSTSSRHPSSATRTRSTRVCRSGRST